MFCAILIILWFFFYSPFAFFFHLELLTVSPRVSIEMLEMTNSRQSELVSPKTHMYHLQKII